ncbi:MAG: glycosyltransferase family 2 protein [Magnetococcales bacterium]|nr:glycosyltransferase family 2 protein [Magnetococcales bacterium]
MVNSPEVTEQAPPAADAPLPKVSVVTPIYNGARHIEETIRSVMAQSFDDWEMIVVDNASSDESRGHIRRLMAQEPRLRLLERSWNSGGPARPRNDGIRVARGEYVAFLDADDRWKPEKLAQQVAFIEAPEQAGTALVFCKMLVSYQSGELVALGREYLPPPPLESGGWFERLLMHNVIITVTVMVRRQALMGLPELFREDPYLNTWEDLDLWLRLARSGHGFAFQDAFLAIYRHHDENLSAPFRHVRNWFRLNRRWGAEMSPRMRRFRFWKGVRMAMINTATNWLMPRWLHRAIRNRYHRATTVESDT